jgi:uncharacterized coiled-coil protein SlyX
MKRIAVLVLMLSCNYANAQTLDERLTSLEASTNSILNDLRAINAVVARQKSDINDLQLALKQANDKLDALLQAQKVTMTPSVPDWSGQQTWTITQPPQNGNGQPMMYSAPPMRTGILRGGIFRGRLLGRGGSCGAGG